MSTKPDCYNTQADYDGWADLVRESREAASPCTDCPKEYQTRMLRQKRCDEKTVRKVFLIRRSAQTKNIDTKEVASV